MLDQNEKEQIQISLLIFGDISVGKTTFINAWLCELLQLEHPFQILPFKTRESTKWILKIKKAPENEIYLEIFIENNAEPQRHIFATLEDLKVFYKNLEQ